MIIGSRVTARQVTPAAPFPAESPAKPNRLRAHRLHWNGFPTTCACWASRKTRPMKCPMSVPYMGAVLGRFARPVATRRPREPSTSLRFWTRLGLEGRELAHKRQPWHRARSKKTRRHAGLSRNGETRTRTGDTTIFSRVLYQLSYLAEPPRWYLARRGRRWSLTAARVGSGGLRTSGVVPGQQVGQRVDGVRSGHTPAAHPHLKVQVRCGRVASLADLADRAAGGQRRTVGDG